MRFPNRDRWGLLSPLLDELLELDEVVRGRRVAALGAIDPTLAGELQSLLDGAERLKTTRFLLGRADDDL